jgi:hypothetical protein
MALATVLQIKSNQFKQQKGPLFELQTRRSSRNSSAGTVPDRNRRLNTISCLINMSCCSNCWLPLLPLPHDSPPQPLAYSAVVQFHQS